MASGLKPVPFDLSPTGLTDAYLKAPDIEHIVFHLQYGGPPGKVFEYFSQISSLIAIIVERATGEKYADLLSKELWTELGADDAYVTLDRPGGLARTAASLLAKPQDWVRVGMLFLNDGLVGGHRVLGSTWLSQMTSPSASNPNYGFQIWRASPYLAERFYSTSDPAFKVKASEPLLAADTVYFDGAIGRRVYISRANETVIVRLGDTDLGWEDSWLPNAVYRALGQCAPATQHAESSSAH
jgi:CubicO group peptidase (beta-lactamase class C family)